jgi:Bacterial self-protective colicin-like immunity
MASSGAGERVTGDPHQLRPYLDLIDALSDRRLSPMEFRAAYFDAFQEDGRSRPERVFLILDGLFADADSYHADPALRDAGGLDDDGLRAAAREARTHLARFVD